MDLDIVPRGGDMLREEWRAVPGYGGWYEVSTCGRVRSWRKRGSFGGSGKRREHPILLTWTASSDTYPSVTLFKDGVRKRVRVHRLVAETFLGPAPFEGAMVCHNNGDCRDNHIQNLRWDTPAGNTSDRYNHGTVPFGEKNTSSKLTEAEVREARRLWDSGEYTVEQLAKRFNMSNAIWQVVSRNNWKHVS